MWLPWLEMKQLRTVGPFPFRVSASASLVGHVHQIWESKQLFAVAFPANFLHWKSYLAELPPFYGKRIGLMSLMEHVNRKRPNLMVKTMVSCRFSIHQKMRTSARRLAYAVAAGICAIGVYAVHGILDQQALFGVTLGRTCLGIFFFWKVVISPYFTKQDSGSNTKRGSIWPKSGHISWDGLQFGGSNHQKMASSQKWTGISKVGLTGNSWQRKHGHEICL